MTNIHQLRHIVTARRSVGDKVAETLSPIEANAHQVAAQLASLVGMALNAHTDIALGPNEGMEAFSLLSEAAHHAGQSRVKIGAAHEALRRLATEKNIVVAGPANCPPNEYFFGDA